MKAKYVEEEFPRYFIFGEHADGSVDIATSSDDTVATVSRVHAEKLVAHRDAVVQKLCDMAMAFDEADSAAFEKFWYV